MQLREQKGRHWFAFEYTVWIPQVGHFMIKDERDVAAARPESIVPEFLLTRVNFLDVIFCPRVATRLVTRNF